MRAAIGARLDEGERVHVDPGSHETVDQGGAHVADANDREIAEVFHLDKATETAE